MQDSNSVIVREVLPVAILDITEVNTKVKHFSLSAPEKLTDAVYDKVGRGYQSQGGNFSRTYSYKEWSEALSTHQMISVIESSGYLLEHFSASGTGSSNAGGSIRCLFRSSERIMI